MELDEIRRKIDRIDACLVRLMERRMELALETRHMKKEIVDEARESGIREQIKKHPTKMLGDEFLEDIFSRILSYSRKLQENAEAEKCE